MMRIDRLEKSLAKIYSVLKEQKLIGLPTGVRAPDFTLQDEAGADRRLVSFRGVPLLLIFSSSSCPNCVAMYASIRAAALEYPGTRFVLITGDSPEKNKELKGRLGFSFPILEGSEELKEQYQVIGVPFFFLLDERGIIRDKGSVLTAKELERLLSGL